MDQFRCSRILVLDDDPREALTVVKALQMMGLTALYYDGAFEDPPPAKLNGIRVLFLDMVLAAHGADANDHKACAAMVVGALERLLEPNCDPLVVICWTGHPEIKDQFESQFRNTFGKNKIGTVLLATKPASQDLSSTNTFNQLKNTLDQGLAEHGPLSLLFSWESRALKAAFLTGDRLAELITKFCSELDSSVSWSDCAFRICAAMALGERGLRLERESDIEAVAAFHGALNPLLLDRLEHSTPLFSSNQISKDLLAAVKTEVERRKKSAALVQEEVSRDTVLRGVWENLGADFAAHLHKNLPESQPISNSHANLTLLAALNRMILLSSQVVQNEIRPGNLYLMDSTTNGTKFNQAIPKIDWANIEKDTFFGTPIPSSFSWPVVLEFSASCDFAQAKIRVPRLVAGYLVHESILDRVPKQAAFIRIIGPMLMSETKPKIEGIFWLVFNSHYVVSAAAEYARKWACFARVRSEALSDITSWITSHMARPGYLHLEA